jgi:hypothetical protein
VKKTWDLTIEVSEAIDQGGPRCGMTVSRRPRFSGVFIGEVATPQQLAKLGVPVAELVEEN